MEPDRSVAVLVKCWEAVMQKKFGIVVVAAIQVAGQKQHSRPGVSKSSRRRVLAAQVAPVSVAA